MKTRWPLGKARRVRLPRTIKADYTVQALRMPDAPFVYRLGREIFILERRVRLP